MKCAPPAQYFSSVVAPSSLDFSQRKHSHHRAHSNSVTYFHFPFLLLPAFPCDPGVCKTLLCLIADVDTLHCGFALYRRSMWRVSLRQCVHRTVTLVSASCEIAGRYGACCEIADRYGGPCQKLTPPPPPCGPSSSSQSRPLCPSGGSAPGERPQPRSHHSTRALWGRGGTHTHTHTHF